ncbi:MAG TPA: DUF5343 domain-containing protein [Pyrinomonadaceae bacterium]|nr:DUF5343 domain-containing protein [Pyrinomonadaceae bacterium]
MDIKPPYLPFKSFLTALDRLAQAIPPTIGKDVFPHHSGALQGQILGALRFLDLIDEKGRPNGKKLERLANEKDVDARRTNIRPLISSAYSEILKIGLETMTPSQLDSAFERYGVSGDTKKKAKTFFIKAATFADMDVSPLLIRRNRRATSGKKRKAHPRDARSSAVADERTIDSDPSQSKTVDFGKNVSLTVSLRGNVFELDGKDRELVFSIMDQLKSHSGSH